MRTIGSTAESISERNQLVVDRLAMGLSRDVISTRTGASYAQIKKAERDFLSRKATTMKELIKKMRVLLRKENLRPGMASHEIEDFRSSMAQVLDEADELLADKKKG